MNSQRTFLTPLFVALGLLVLSTAGVFHGLPQGLWCGLGIGLEMTGLLLLRRKTPQRVAVRPLRAKTDR